MKKLLILAILSYSSPCFAMRIYGGGSGSGGSSSSTDIYPATSTAVIPVLQGNVSIIQAPGGNTTSSFSFEPKNSSFSSFGNLRYISGNDFPSSADGLRLAVQSSGGSYAIYQRYVLPNGGGGNYGAVQFLDNEGHNLLTAGDAAGGTAAFLSTDLSITSNGANVCLESGVHCPASGGGGGTTIWVEYNQVPVNNTVSSITVNGVLKSTSVSSGRASVFLNYDTNQFTNSASTFSALSSSFTLLGPNPPAASIASGILGASVIASSVAASRVVPGSYGTATQISSFTVGVDGRISNIANVTATPAATSITGGVLGPAVIASSVSASGVTPGSYTNTNLTVGTDGRITTASNGTSGGSSVNISSGPTFASTNTITLTNSVAETSLRGIGYGSSTFTANSFYVGETILTHASGLLSDAAVAQGTLTIKFKVGGITLAATTAFTPTANQSNSVWNLTSYTTIRSLGASGTAILNTSFVITDTLGITQDVYPMSNSSPVTIDTTKAVNDFDLTATWGTASGSNIITCTNWIVDNFNGNNGSTSTSSGSGTSVYNSTSTAGFPFGANVSTITMTNATALGILSGLPRVKTRLTGVVSIQNLNTDSPDSAGVFTAVASTSTGSPSFVTFRRSSGTTASPVATSTSMVMGSFSAGGYGTTGWSASSSGKLEFIAEGDFTDTSQPTACYAFTTPSGSIAVVKRGGFASDGGFIVNGGSVTISLAGGFAVNNSTFVVNIATNSSVMNAAGDNFAFYQSTSVFNSVDITTGTSTLINIPNYQWKCAANEVWGFEANFANTGITAGTEYGINAPVASTATMIVWGNTSAVATFSMNTVTSLNTASTVAMTTSNGTALMTRLSGTVQCGATAGAINLMWKSVTVTQISTIKAGSYLKATRIN